MPASSLKALISAFLIALGLSGAPSPVPDRLGLPSLVLWSWDRSDDLRFIDPANTAVAYLAATIHLAGDAVVVIPRRNPLLLPPSTRTVAVLHIELDRQNPPALDPEQLAAVVEAVAQEAAEHPGRLQLDFEVVQSQQPFLTATVDAVRQRVPDLPLSLTALSSWCQTEHWVNALPVDEIVPMVFRLGPERPLVLARLSDGGDFRDAACRGAYGIATDELPDAALPRARRIYIFNPKPWTAETYDAVRKKLSSWSVLSSPS